MGNAWDNLASGSGGGGGGGGANPWDSIASGGGSGIAQTGPEAFRNRSYGPASGGSAGVFGNALHQVGDIITGVPAAATTFASSSYHDLWSHGLSPWGNHSVLKMDITDWLHNKDTFGGRVVEPQIQGAKADLVAAKNRDWHYFEQHPLNPVLDALAVASVGGKAALIGGDSSLAARGLLGKTAKHVATTDRTLTDGDLTETLNQARTVQGRILQRAHDRWSETNTDARVFGAGSRMTQILNRRVSDLMVRAHLPLRVFQELTRKLTDAETFAYHVVVEPVTLQDRIAFFEAELERRKAIIAKREKGWLKKPPKTRARRVPSLRPIEKYLDNLKSKEVRDAIEHPRQEFIDALEAGAKVEGEAGRRLMETGALHPDTRAERVDLPARVMEPPPPPPPPAPPTFTGSSLPPTVPHTGPVTFALRVPRPFFEAHMAKRSVIERAIEAGTHEGDNFGVMWESGKGNARRAHVQMDKDALRGLLKDASRKHPRPLSDSARATRNALKAQEHIIEDARDRTVQRLQWRHPHGGDWHVEDSDIVIRHGPKGYQPFHGDTPIGPGTDEKLADAKRRVERYVHFRRSEEARAEAEAQTAAEAAATGQEDPFMAALDSGGDTMAYARKAGEGITHTPEDEAAVIQEVAGHLPGFEGSTLHELREYADNVGAMDPTIAEEAQFSLDRATEALDRAAAGQAQDFRPPGVEPKDVPPEGTIHVLRVPPRFYEDHLSRDLPERGYAEVVSKSRSGWLVRMDDRALSDLRSDAEHYSDPQIAREVGQPGLSSSAKATLRALDKKHHTEPVRTEMYDAKNAVDEPTNEWDQLHRDHGQAASAGDLLNERLANQITNLEMHLGAARTELHDAMRRGDEEAARRHAAALDQLEAELKGLEDQHAELANHRYSEAEAQKLAEAPAASVSKEAAAKAAAKRDDLIREIEFEMNDPAGSRARATALRQELSDLYDAHPELRPSAEAPAASVSEAASPPSEGPPADAQNYELPARNPAEMGRGNVHGPMFPPHYRFPHYREAITPGAFLSPKVEAMLGKNKPLAQLKHNSAVLLTNALMITDPERVISRDYLSTMRHLMIDLMQRHFLDKIAREPMGDLVDSGFKPKDWWYYRPSYDRATTASLPRDVAKSESLTADRSVIDTTRAKEKLTEKSEGIVSKSLEELRLPDGADLHDLATLKEYGIKIIPRAYGKDFRNEFARTNAAIRYFYDRPMDVWRAITLNYRPAWIVNNFVGNGVMGLATYGPAGAAAYLHVLLATEHGDRKVLKLWKFTKSVPTLRRKYGRIFDELAPQLHSAGLFGTQTKITHGGIYEGRYAGVLDSKGLRLLNFTAGNVGRGVMRVGQGLTRLEILLAEDTGREAAFLRETVGDVKRIRETAKKMGEGNIAYEEALKRLDRSSVERAVQRVNDALGDFNDLNAGERSIIRRIVPFYSWFKVITKVSAKYAARYPARVLMLKNITDARDRSGELALPSWLGGSVLIGGPSKRGTQSLISTAGLNPYETIPQIATGGVGSVVTPFISSGIIGASGVDPSFGAAKDYYGLGASKDFGWRGDAERFAGSFIQNLAPFQTAEKAHDYKGKLYAPHNYHFGPLTVNDFWLQYFGVPIRHVRLNEARRERGLR